MIAASRRKVLALFGAAPFTGMRIDDWAKNIFKRLISLE